MTANDAKEKGEPQKGILEERGRGWGGYAGEYGRARYRMSV